jgi:outer membrane protein OmpA-like peptidoglycan-associated protein
MKKLLLTSCFHSLLLVTVLAQKDKPECSDSIYRLFSKMEDFYVDNCERFEFKTIEYWIESNSKRVTKEGKYTKVHYKLSPASTRQLMGKQIVDNYTAAVKRVKGTVIPGSENQAYHLSNNGRSIWVVLSVNVNSGQRTEYYIETVEEAVMKQEIETSLQEAIAEEGKAVFYGILFDVGKAVVKPESAGEIKTIADYLTANSNASIFIVGHTDNTGNYLANIKLSKLRAAAVRTYLITKFKIDGKRLVAEGVGQLSPVATNGTEEGKKLNRRVEVVLK